MSTDVRFLDDYGSDTSAWDLENTEVIVAGKIVAVAVLLVSLSRSLKELRPRDVAAAGKRKESHRTLE